MDSYTSFSYVYDTFMDQEPYDEWADRVCAYLAEYGLSRSEKSGGEENIVVDLGCGTGKLTQILADRGYDMIGIDLSEDMLSIARSARSSPAGTFSTPCRTCAISSSTGLPAPW